MDAQVRPNRWAAYLLPVMVAILTLVTFLPVLSNQFLNWDDIPLIVQNNGYRGLTRDHLRYIFTATTRGHYEPLTWLSFTFDHFVSGISARGTHLTNLLLHTLNAVLFYFLTLRLIAAARQTTIRSFGLPERIAAAASALLFAIHPLRVEVVSWITARSYLLAGVFFLLSILAYLRAVPAVSYLGQQSSGFRRGHHIASLMCFILSLSAIQLAVALPVVLLILDVYPLRRLGSVGGGWWGPRTRRVWLEKVSFFVVAIAAAVVATSTKEHASAIRSHFTLAQRAAVVAYSLRFALEKTFWPAGLSPFYALYSQMDPVAAQYFVSGLVVLGLTVCVVLLRKSYPSVWAAWFCFVVLIAPVSGIVIQGLQITADRYSYLSCMGFSVVIAAAGLWWYQHAGRRRINRALIMTAAGTIVLASLMAMTWQYSRGWRNSESLWRRVMSVDPDSYLGCLNLGSVYVDEGRYDEADELFSRALAANPNHSILQRNLGYMAVRRGNLRLATVHYETAVRVAPTDSVARTALVQVLFRRGIIDQAIQVLRNGLVITPNNSEDLNSLAWLLATTPDPKLRNGVEAIELAKRALANAPDDLKPLVLDTLAAAYAEAGDFHSAEHTARQAIDSARQKSSADLIEEMRRRLQLFRAGLPYHVSATETQPTATRPAGG